MASQKMWDRPCCCLWRHHAAQHHSSEGLQLSTVVQCSNMPRACLYVPFHPRRRFLHWDRNYHPGKDQQHKRVQMSASAADLGLKPAAGAHRRAHGAALAADGS